MATYMPNTKQEKAGIDIFLLDKVQFIMRNITRNKEECFIIIKRSVHQEDITIFNVYAPNKRASE